jgi:mRNA interferase RelE/StbE
MDSGYDVARMAKRIVLAPQAIEDLRRLPASRRAEVVDGIERVLRHRPSAISKSRIKRLRGLDHPQLRLRIREVRIFYDIRGETVEILAIVAKSAAEDWLQRLGE